LESLLGNILESGFDWLIDPAKRTYILYWLTSLFIVLGWASFRWSKRKQYLLQLSHSSYWLNPSTYQDYFLVIFNRVIFYTIGISWLIITLDISLTTLGFLRKFGETTQEPLFDGWVIVLYSLSVFLFDDFSRFALHKAMHKFNFLWRIHQVHHSATTLTPITALRVHPLESLLYQIRGALVYGISAGTGFFLFGYQVNQLEIWGVIATSFLFNVFGANIRHSQVPLHYGRLEKWLISPSMHQAHHGLTTMQKNFGSILSIWDRIGGSWRSGKLPYELPKTDHPLGRQLLLKPISWK